MIDAIYRIKTMMAGLGKSEVKLPMLPFQRSKLNYIFTSISLKHRHRDTLYELRGANKIGFFFKQWINVSF